MTDNSKIVKLDSIDAYNKLYGLKTLHPLVSIINLNHATEVVNHIQMDYGVYALFLKNGANCVLKYGREPYDYQEGTIVSFSPGQLIGVETEIDEFAPDVIGLMFHPDLIYNTPLAEKIAEYSFFEYSQREALHLSEDERYVVTNILSQIHDEIAQPIDKHTAEIVSSLIQLLLDRLTRFYDRQFITRKKANSHIVDNFFKELKRYYSDTSNITNTPSVNYFAGKAALTPGYFGDLVKNETGKTAQEIISLHVIDTAKKMLCDRAGADISEIAYALGFQHPQHFSRMFKRATNETPTEFRKRMQRC